MASFAVVIHLLMLKVKLLTLSRLLAPGILLILIIPRSGPAVNCVKSYEGFYI